MRASIKDRDNKEAEYQDRQQLRHTTGLQPLWPISTGASDGSDATRQSVRRFRPYEGSRDGLATLGMAPLSIWLPAGSAHLYQHPVGKIRGRPDTDQKTWSFPATFARIMLTSPNAAMAVKTACSGSPFLHHLNFEPLLRHNPVARLARRLDAGCPQAR
jgi:hypothetical protein